MPTCLVEYTHKKKIIISGEWARGDELFSLVSLCSLVSIMSEVCMGIEWVLPEDDPTIHFTKVSPKTIVISVES